MVDKQAKISLSLEPTSFKIPFSNFKPSQPHSYNFLWENTNVQKQNCILFMKSNVL